MIPISTGLFQRELIFLGLSGQNGWGGKVRYTIEKVRQYNSMPVNGGFYIHFIFHVDNRVTTFGKTKCWPGNTIINGHSKNFLARLIHFFLFECKVISLSLIHISEPTRPY